MDNNIEKQLEALKNEVTGQQQTLQRSVTINWLIYGILVLFVAIYTTVVMNKISKMATPENLSALVVSRIESALPQQREALTEQIKKQIPEGINFLIKQSHDAVPALEEQVKKAIEGLTDNIAATVTEEMLPEFTAVLADQAPIISKKLKGLKGGEKDEHLVADVLLLTLQENLDDFMNEKMADAIDKLTADIKQMAKPKATLTRQQSAEKRVLLYWTFLTRTKKLPESSLSGKVVEKFINLKDNFKIEGID
ncbi:MAG: hypothetical protein U9O87_11405 [Verrucomicrobiota bacterium]|nr:hypothetical protein [Verrucomicrobiota bacterium]